MSVKVSFKSTIAVARKLSQLFAGKRMSRHCSIRLVRVIKLNLGTEHVRTRSRFSRTDLVRAAASLSLSLSCSSFLSFSLVPLSHSPSAEETR